MILNSALVDQIGLVYNQAYGVPCPVYSDRVQGDRFVAGPTWGKDEKKLMVSYQDAFDVLEIIGPLCAFGGSDVYGDYTDRRGLTIACRLTGLRWDHIQKAVGDVCNFGAKTAANAWFEYMKPKDFRVCGFLYVARLRAGGIKIGFSTNPFSRINKMKGGASLISIFPATMLHEWALHQILRRYSIASEVYPESILKKFPFLISEMLEAA